MLHWSTPHSQLLALGFNPEDLDAVPRLLCCVKRSLTAHCPAHCPTYVLPDLQLGSTATVLVYSVSDSGSLTCPRGLGTWAFEGGRLCWRRLQKAGTFTSSDTCRQMGQLQNWVLCFNSLVLQQKLPEAARLKAGRTWGHQPDSICEQWASSGWHSVPSIVWPHSPNSAPSLFTGVCPFWKSISYFLDEVSPDPILPILPHFYLPQIPLRAPIMFPAPGSLVCLPAGI